MKSLLVILLMGIVSVAAAQIPYKVDATIKDFNAPLVLNYKNRSSSYNQLKAGITIIDFFGTWCVPCIKGLPVLDVLQKEFPERLRVLLVSTETEERLTRFIDARTGFAFPVIVDKASAITNLFEPAAYPYTVVLDKNNTILAITDAASITKENVNMWLEGKKPEIAHSSIPEKKTGFTVMNTNESSNNKTVALSQELMYAAKTGGEIEAFIQKMSNYSYELLKKDLVEENDKKSFWINAYNGYTQALLRKTPEAYKNRGKFFKSRRINIAGKKFSLDDIEHGILRRSKVKWSLGYFNKWFPRKTEKELRVASLDYRLHFALNCGAKSCPPVAFYNPENLDKQLDAATTAYLAGEAVYNANKNTLGLPAIMGWFRWDFGGKKKMLQLVKEKGIIPADAKPAIHFNKYDWELHLNNFQ